MTTQRIVEINLDNAEATERLGFELALQVQDQAVVALVGPLGAGKTTFAKGAADGLGVEEVVNSPTFTMLNEYMSGRIPFYHLDLYRLREDDGQEKTASPADLDMLRAELDEITSSNGLILIEWANFFEPYVRQQDHVLVELNYSKSAAAGSSSPTALNESGRQARVSAIGPRSAQIVEELQNVYFS